MTSKSARLNIRLPEEDLQELDGIRGAPGQLRAKGGCKEAVGGEIAAERIDDQDPLRTARRREEGCAGQDRNDQRKTSPSPEHRA